MIKETAKVRLLSFVFPAYNEEQNISKAISRAIEFAQNRNLKYEVIVVDDGSQDKTRTIISNEYRNNKMVHLLKNGKNLGYGATLWRGLKAARGNLIFLNDSDLQFDLNDLDRFLEKIDRYDVVIGYRKKRSEGIMRRINASGWKLMIRIFLGMKIKDVDCAFKLFKTKVLNNIKIQSGGAMFSAELIYKIQQNNYRILQLPVQHFIRQHGKPTGAKPKVIFRAFKELIKFMRNLSNQ